MHTGARRQIRPEFPDGGVEPDSSNLASPIRGRYGKGALVPADQVQQAPVCDLHSFGLPGRSRCVDDVGKLSGVASVTGDERDGPSASRPSISKPITRQAPAGNEPALHCDVTSTGAFASFKMKDNRSAGSAGSSGKVSPARFEDSERTHNHRDGTLEAEANHDIRAYTDRT